jgi:hypothetical protein
LRFFIRPIARNGWIRKAPPPVSGWTTTRDFPLITHKSLRSRFADHRNRDGQ